VWAAGICYCLFRMPLPVGDCLDEIVEVQHDAGAAASFARALTSAHYFRPLRVAQTRLLFDAASGHYWLAYRGFHALLVVVAFGLVAAVARVRDAAGVAAFAAALTILVGHHGFLGNVKEIYPINHFLEVLICSLSAFLVSRHGRPRWGDAVALVLFAVATLTLESGVLVWCVFVAAWLTGLSGVSSRGVGVVTIAAIAYVVVRSIFVEVPLTALQATGFGGRVRDPAELQALFGSPPILLFAYNAVSAALSVLFSEPRAGVWLTIRSYADGIPPRVLINIASSALSTGVLAWFVARRRPAWRAGTFMDADRVMIVFLATLAGTAAVSFAYTKNEILGTAAAFYALAVYGAVRELVIVMSRRRTGVRLLVATAMVALSLLWAVRSAGLFHNLRTEAFNHRNDWASVEELLDPSHPLRSEQRGRALVLQLRREALAMPAANPHFLPRWTERIFDVDW
jgi:hypothetical protein